MALAEGDYMTRQGGLRRLCERDFADGADVLAACLALRRDDAGGDGVIDATDGASTRGAPR